MALSQRQTQIVWRQHNRVRGRFFKKYTRLWRQLYAVQGESIASSYAVDGLLRPADVLPDATKDLFVELYEDVGVHFAELAFLNIKQVGNLAEWERLMERYALTFGGQSIVSINSSNLSQAQKIIQQATAEAVTLGLTVDQTTAFIEAEILQEWRQYGKFSAERIARTEIVSASNQGSFVGAKSTGLTLQKTWLTALDGRERDTHGLANGQQVDMNTSFIVGNTQMMHPGDKNAPAEEVINCRCSVAFGSTLTR